MSNTETRYKAVSSILPATRNAAVNGTSVNRYGYQSLAFTAIVGAVTDGTHTVKLQESDDNTTFTDVAASDIDGAFANLAANTPQTVYYVGTKQYVRAASSSSGTTGAAFGVVAILARANHTKGAY